MQSEVILGRIKFLLIRGSAWAFGGKLLNGVAGVLVSALLARLLSPPDLGAYFLVFSIVNLGVGVAILGLNETVVRIIAEAMGTDQPGRAERAIHFALILTVIGTLVVAGVLAFGGGEWLAIQIFNSPVMAQVMGVAALWVVTLAFQSLLAECFRGFHDIRFASIFSGLARSVLCVVIFTVLWCLQGQAELREIILWSVLASAASLVGAALLLRQRLKRLGAEGELQSKEVLHIAWPIWLAGLMSLVLTQADLWILGMFRSQDEVAIYGSVARLVLMVIVPLAIMNSVVPPIIAELYAQGKKQELESTLRTTATLAGLPTFIVLICFFVFGSQVLGVVYGDFYSEGALILTILSGGQFVNVWSGSCGVTLKMTGHQSSLLMITVLSGSLAIAGSILLVKEYGLTGVAWASTLAKVFHNILMLLLAHNKTGIWTHMGLNTPKKLLMIKS